MVKILYKECDNENDDKLNSFVLRFNDSLNNDLNKNIWQNIIYEKV